ncbi:MAG TPA: response regulator [Bryobacteraceae bacterium]|nr:response regulator [Bryobacteraceae bacterium]
MARILLVDDDADGIALRKLILERAGHCVAVATNAEEARERYRESAPDAAILDLRLPRAENGRALIRDLRRDLPGVRILTLSGWSADLDGCAERELIDALFTKPAAPERLLSAINSLW